MTSDCNFSLYEDTTGHWRISARKNPTYQFYIYPLDSNRNKPPQKLSQIVGETVVDRLQTKSASQPQTTALLGECHKNSVDLAHNLLSRGYQPYIISGSTQDNCVNSFRDAYHTLSVHYWVELGNYTVELCSEETNSTGHIYISQRTPPDYTPYRKTTPQELESTASFTYPTKDTMSEYISLSEPYSEG
jgi:hypothetical protein